MSQTSNANSNSGGSTSPSTLPENILDAIKLTAKEADAQLSKQVVKPNVVLKSDGTNFYQWKKNIISQGRTKCCHMAFFKDYPDSGVDSAAYQLLLGSLPEHLQSAISGIDTARQSFDYICANFSGGSNLEANMTWLRDLKAGMKPTETLDVAKPRVVALVGSLALL